MAKVNSNANLPVLAVISLIILTPLFLEDAPQELNTAS